MKCEQCEKVNYDGKRLTEFDRDGSPEMLCDDCASDERKQAQYTAHADLHATAATMLSLLESARKLKKEKTR